MSLCSLDTNVLLYASNEDAPEHTVCKGLLEQVIKEPTDWVIADQVYLELYRGLRNPRVMANPLSAKLAAKHIAILRDELGVSHCGYDAGCWQSLMQSLEADDFPYRRTHDAVLAATLLGHGVRTFYTRNLKDFRDAGFERIIDPLGAM